MLDWLFKHVPRRKDLQGSWLHRLAGERLFSPTLWKLSKNRVATGLALGIFVGLTPTMGIQMIIAGLCALALRTNIAAGLAGCWITNPLSAPFIYTLEYKIGCRLLQTTCPAYRVSYHGLFENALRIAKPLWLGSLICAVLGAVIVYCLTIICWQQISGKLDAQRKQRNP